MKGTGLMCRAERTCRERYMPRDTGSIVSLQQAVKERDEHERNVHGYTHPVPTAIHSVRVAYNRHTGLERQDFGRTASNGKDYNKAANDWIWQSGMHPRRGMG